MLLASLLFAIGALLARAATVNRQIRRKLRSAAVLVAVAVAVTLALLYAPVPPALAVQLRTLQSLLVALAVIIFVVTLALNPWREDRIPDRLPNIVQDGIVIGLFALVAAFMLQDRALVTGAAAAVVIGLAVQETLGNLAAGLAIQTEKPFHVGQWVSISGKDGLVTEITWRATKIRTKTGNFVIVPHSVLARDTITNYSEPTSATRIDVDIAAGYDHAPNDVKAAILDAIRFEPLIDQERELDVFIHDFAESGITYRARVWITDFASDDRLRDRVRSHVYYEFGRRHIAFPYPVRALVRLRTDDPRSPDRIAWFERVVRDTDIFAPLSDEQCAELVRSARDRVYGAGETIVREGEPGSSVFLLCRGDVRVTAGPAATEVARLSVGAHFGEMSMLTGEPRSATVSAAVDSELLEIDAEDFRRLVLADAALLERMSVAVAERRSYLDEIRGSSEPEAVAEEPRSLLVRIQNFFGSRRPLNLGLSSRPKQEP